MALPGSTAPREPPDYRPAASSAYEPEHCGQPSQWYPAQPLGGPAAIATGAAGLLTPCGSAPSAAQNLCRWRADSRTDSETRNTDTYRLPRRRPAQPARSARTGSAIRDVGQRLNRHRRQRDPAPRQQGRNVVSIEHPKLVVRVQCCPAPIDQLDERGSRRQRLAPERVDSLRYDWGGGKHCPAMQK